MRPAWLSCLHGTKDPEFGLASEIDLFMESMHRVDAVVTSCRLIARRLIGWGASPDRISVIPLGVDTTAFTPPDDQQRRKVRRRLGVPDDAICIGSFQKDGVGWNEGMELKAVKGPDILVEAIGRLAKTYPIFVLLTGPGRGYVKKALHRLGVPFRHFHVKRHRDIVHCYRALDLYLVSSRDEGGPLALPEGMACGVAIVSTPVGMAPEMIRHGVNGYLAEPENPESLSAFAARLIEDPRRRQDIGCAAAATAREYDWRGIALRHLDEVYKPLLVETKPRRLAPSVSP